MPDYRQIQNNRALNNSLLEGAIAPQQNQSIFSGLARILAARKIGKNQQGLDAQEEELKQQKHSELARIMAAGEGRRLPTMNGLETDGPPEQTQGGRGELLSAMGESALPEYQEMALKAQIAPDKSALGAPSHVRELEYLNSLKSQFGEDSEQVKDYWRNKRGGFNAGGVRYDVNGKAIIDPNIIAQNKGNIAAQVETDKINAKDQAQAKLDLPMMEFSTDTMLDRIDSLMEHPGFAGIIGLKDYSGLIPGSAEQGALARLEQIQGDVFMQAYQKLKGGGQITEVEGKKAEQSLIRLSRAQSEQEFREAAEDFKVELNALREMTRQRAGGGQPSPQAQPQQPTEPSIDDLINQYGS